MNVFRMIVLTCVILAQVEGRAGAALQTYEIKDIGNFAGYTTANVGQSYAGTGFVGLYSTEFAHLFGLEINNYSKTALQVDISALSGATINSAYLTFDLLNGSGGTQNINVTSFTADGTLEHFWSPPSNLGVGAYSVNGLASNSLDVTTFVQERATANADWLGLHLQATTLYEWTYTYTGYGYNDDSAKVRLVVDYTAGNGVVPSPRPSLFGLAWAWPSLAQSAPRSAKLCERTLSATGLRPKCCIPRGQTAPGLFR